MIKESRSWIKIVGTTILVIWILPILYLLGCLGYSTMVKFNIFEYCYGEGFFILWIVGITIVLLIGGAILYGINRLSNLIRKKF